MDFVLKIQNETAWFAKKRSLLKIWKLLNVNFSKGAYLVLKFPIVCQETRLKTLRLQYTYTAGWNVWGDWVLAVNHHNHKIWVPFILTHNLWLKQGMKQKNWPTQKPSKGILTTNIAITYLNGIFFILQALMNTTLVKNQHIRNIHIICRYIKSLDFLKVWNQQSSPNLESIGNIFLNYLVKIYHITRWF